MKNFHAGLFFFIIFERFAIGRTSECRILILKGIRKNYPITFQCLST